MGGVSLSNATGSLIKFTGVQLEPGPVATPFEHRPIGTELALCQRYYQIFPLNAGSKPVSNAPNGVVTVNNFLWRSDLNFIETMRTTPTATFNNMTTLYNADSILLYPQSPSLFTYGPINTTSNINTGFDSQAGFTANLIFEAEL